MRLEKAFHSLIKVGPGGRRCACCAPISTELKRLEHKKSRREIKRFIKEEIRKEEFKDND